MIKDLMIFILVVCLAGALVFGCMIGFNIMFNINYCNTNQELMPQVNFKWVMWGGCLLEAPDGTWVSADDYLSVDRLRLQMEGDIK